MKKLLWKVTSTHFAPKGSGSATYCFCYAQTSRGVLDQVCEDAEDWSEERREECAEFCNTFDECFDWGDFHYGYTSYSWEIWPFDPGPDVIKGLGLNP